jgi:hypothetical protein
MSKHQKIRVSRWSGVTLAGSFWIEGTRRKVQLSLPARTVTRIESAPLGFRCNVQSATRFELFGGDVVIWSDGFRDWYKPEP